MDDQEDYYELEEEILQEEDRKEKKRPQKMKVSGKGVFTLKEELEKQDKRKK